jgi:hypothetical protein
LVFILHNIHMYFKFSIIATYVTKIAQNHGKVNIRAKVNVCKEFFS